MLRVRIMFLPLTNVLKQYTRLKQTVSTGRLLQVFSRFNIRHRKLIWKKVFDNLNHEGYSTLHSSSTNIYWEDNLHNSDIDTVK